METPNIIKEHQATILQSLNRHLGPCTIFALDEHRKNTNPCLLAFANPTNPQAAAAAANVITEKTNTTVSILLHKTTDLNTKQKDQQHFFYHALRGYRLCLDKTAVPYYPYDHIPERDWEGAHAFWLKCEAVANFNIAAAVESPHIDVELIKITLLHEAVVQVALGLIRILLGYTPNTQSLGFLLSLCSHFSELPARAFPRETAQQQRLYKRLCAPPAMLRYWNRLNAPEGDFELLLDACSIFLRDTKALAEHKLQLK